MIRWTCQCCAKVLRAKDASVGKRIRCPSCKSVISIPASLDGAQSQIDVDPEPTEAIQVESHKSPNLMEELLWDQLAKDAVQAESAPHTPQHSATFESDISTCERMDEGEKTHERSNPRNRNVIAFAVVLLMCVALVAIGIAGYSFRLDNRKAPQGQDKPRVIGEQAELIRYRDYFSILEVSYERHAVLRMSSDWGRAGFTRVFKDLEAYTAASEVENQAKFEAEQLEAIQLSRRQEFTRIHGLDSRDFIPVFKKQFPERGLIFDEIDVLVRPIFAKQVNNAASHLIEKSKLMGLGAAWTIYRREYLREQAPLLISQVQEEVRGLASINDLRKKLYGKK